LRSRALRVETRRREFRDPRAKTVTLLNVAPGVDWLGLNPAGLSNEGYESGGMLLPHIQQSRE